MEFVEEFKAQKEKYNSLKDRVEGLLKDLLENEAIIPHQINSRVKTEDSLTKKILKKDKYKSLNEITDIIGFRIITYLESDVDKVEELIRKEFQIDLANSIDKRQQTANEFGYRSLHLVSQLDDSRLKLTEYKKYSEIKFEIQIRSILQHAWAEIEHDLGYKSKSSLPNNTKRSFNRLAALLESADIEFDRLKKDLTGYKESVENEIIISPQSVPINQASIGSLSLSNPTFVNLREFLTEKYDVEFYEENEFYDYLEVFQLFNINNIKQLQDLIETNSEDFFKFIIEFLSNKVGPILSINMPIFWFQHYLAASTMDENIINQYQNFNGRNLNGDSCDYILPYKKIKGYI